MSAGREQLQTAEAMGDEVRAVHIETEEASPHPAHVRLRRINETKDKFLNELCHELRAPLINVMSFLEFLKEGYVPEEEIKSLSAHLHGEVKRLESLINDMLDLAKIEAGKLEYVYKETRLNDIVEQCVAVMSITAKRRNIGLSFNGDPALPLLHLAANRIKQVIVNLLDNAIRFSEDSGEIIVKTENRPDEVRFSIRDFGRGIAAENIPKVFNKFECIEDDDDPSVGRGLGMSLAKNIVEKGHGGRMWVESEGRDKGTLFIFTIPKTSPRQ